MTWMRRGSTSWSEEKLVRLRKLYDDGCSSAAIAHELGTTRNAVIGMVYRLGRKRPDKKAALRLKSDSNAPRSVSAVQKRTQGSTTGGLMFKIAGCIPLRSNVAPEPLPVVAASSSMSVPFCDLAPRQCRWIAGEPGWKAPACGDPTVGSLPYCAYHCRRAYASPRSALQKADDAARAARMRLAARRSAANT